MDERDKAAWDLIEATKRLNGDEDDDIVLNAIGEARERLEKLLPPKDKRQGYVNIRFLAQGMIKVPLSEAPHNLIEMEPTDIFGWAAEVMANMIHAELLAAVDYLETLHEDTNPGCLELEEEGKEIDELMRTHEWSAFMSQEAQYVE